MDAACKGEIPGTGNPQRPRTAEKNSSRARKRHRTKFTSHPWTQGSATPIDQCAWEQLPAIRHHRLHSEGAEPPAEEKGMGELEAPACRNSGGALIPEVRDCAAHLPCNK